MSDLNTIREGIIKARQQYNSTRQEWLQEGEKLKRLEENLRQLERSVKPNNDEEPEVLKKLKEDIEETRIKQQSARTKVKEAKAGVGNWRNRLPELERPDQLVEQLPDTHPFLLFPLRLETRFKTVQADNTVLDQLWLRIYPDDCQVETFRSQLSKAELEALRTFWLDYWSAGRQETAEKAAWRTLVSAFGTGRAIWLLDQYRPADPDTRPTKANPDDVLLVIPLNEGVSLDATTRAFWKTYWLATSDTQRSTLETSLAVQVGAPQAQAILDGFRPVNLEETPQPPKQKTDVAVNVVPVTLPDPATILTTQSSWTESPKVTTLPDCFVAMGFVNGTMCFQQVGTPLPDVLPVGIDPSLPADEQLTVKDDELILNEDLKWATDFDEAIKKGLGMKITLPDVARQKIDKLLVLGLRLTSDATAGQQQLEGLLMNHFRSKNGFSLLPQGAPTNNTENQGAGYNTSLEDSDDSYELIFKQKPAITPVDDFALKTDGQWLAEYLGIQSALLNNVPFAHATDQLEARALNTALWPATWGYYLQEMMHPVFSEQAIDLTRKFFTQFVLGRGSVPAIRIGKQPYGILPVTPFSRLNVVDRHQFFDRHLPGAPFLSKLHDLLMRLDKEWENLAEQVSFVGKKGDPHQLLLDVLGLHPNSVEFHQRYAQSYQHWYNQLQLQYTAFGRASYGVSTAALKQSIRQQLLNLGVPLATNDTLPILEKLFGTRNTSLTGSLIDDAPLSEIIPIKPYTADGKNYIEWLAVSSADKIRLQDFGANPTPTALLYLFLRHALLLAYADAGLNIHSTRNESFDKARARLDPDFINVEEKPSQLSKWAYLYQTNPILTDGDIIPLIDYLSKSHILANRTETEQLREAIDALKRLQNVPTARLERAFTEHIDLCHYRLDAWKNGLVAYQLTQQRYQQGQWGRGIYLGAYGWLVNLRSENKILTDVALPADLTPIFAKEGQPPLQKDSTNAGFIHAPSIHQASTAAILRNAYISNQSAADKAAYAVNLSSERVRLATGLLEGIRNGQSLASLLGYRFERSLHDANSLAEVDKFIYPLRRKFPIRADKLKATQTDPGVSLEVIEARNVLDGLAFLNHLKKINNFRYPFGFSTGTVPTDVPPATVAESAVIDAQVQQLLNALDAVSDVGLAESVFQMVQGNPDRSAAVADVFSKGGYPPEIDVIRTQQQGHTLTHRVGLHLKADVNPATSPNSVAVMTPRARANAALNQWLSTLLPDPAQVQCIVTYQLPSVVGSTTKTVTQQALGLQSLDLLYLFANENSAAMTDLDDRLVEFVFRNHAKHVGATITIQYTQPVGGISFFQLGALVRSLRNVVLKSRPLTEDDLKLPTQSAPGAGIIDVTQLTLRVQAARNTLHGQIAPLQALEVSASPTDDLMATAITAMQTVGLYGVPGTDTGFVRIALAGAYARIDKRIDALIKRWEPKLTAFNSRMTGYAALPTIIEKIEFLKEAERLIASAGTATPPANPDTFKTTLESKRDEMAALLAQFKTLRTTSYAKLGNYLSDLTNLLTEAPAYDPVPFNQDKALRDVSDEVATFDTLRTELITKIRQVREESQKLVQEVDDLLTQASGSNTTSAAARLLREAGQKLFGDDFGLIPQFQLPSLAVTELQNAFSNAPGLLTSAQTKHLFPVDDWLAGVSRVREKLYHWENLIALTDAFGVANAGQLTPIQLPFQSIDTWLALEFDPKTYALNEEKLLYTAHLPSASFDATKPVCGLLIDEWTEVIPDTENTTGLTFHFDQPDSEPPQVMLLVTPAELKGHWSWADIVDSLHDTLASAKKRAVEPVHLDQTPLGHLLPATVMATALHQMSIVTNLAQNNKLYSLIKSTD